MNLKQLKKRLNIKYNPFDLHFNIIMWVGDNRVRAGLTQKELAEKCGMLQESIARIEAGRQSPSVKTIERIAKALNKPLLIK